MNEPNSKAARALGTLGALAMAFAQPNTGDTFETHRLRTGCRPKTAKAKRRMIQASRRQNRGRR